MVICGGGLVGTTLALAMAPVGISTLIIDKCPRDSARSDTGKGQVFIITPPTRALFARIGIWQDVRHHAHDIFEIHVGRDVCAAHEDRLLHFGNRDRRGAPIAHIIEGRHLRRALLDAVDNTPSIEMLHGVGLKARHQRADHLDIDLDNGGRVSTRLLAGCDGRLSPTARSSGIGHRDRDFEQVAIVATLSHAPIRPGAAFQFLRPDGPLSILPLTTGTTSIMWTVRVPQAQALMALDDRAFLDEMRAQLPAFLRRTGLVGARFSYPLRASIARRFVAPRTALVGDAAHAFHPVTGQGLNFGARGISKLTQLVYEAHTDGRDIGAQATLRAYARARKADAALMAFATNAIIAFFCSANPALRVAQRSGFYALGAMPRIREALIRHAQGRKMLLPAPSNDDAA